MSPVCIKDKCFLGHLSKCDLNKKLCVHCLSTEIIMSVPCFCFIRQVGEKGKGAINLS